MVSFANLPAAQLLSIIDGLGGDGHGIYDTTFLDKLGVPDEYVKDVADVHESSKSNPKGMIFGPDGKVRKHMIGIYSLSLYRRIANDLGCPGSDKFGRGSEARDLDAQIRAKLAV
jgi:hypothetical protein